MMWIDQRSKRELGNSFLRQRRNLMGLSVVLIIFNLFGEIIDAPIFFRGLMFNDYELIPVLAYALLFYFLWRYCVYKKLEIPRFHHDITDCLNSDDRFREFIKQEVGKNETVLEFVYTAKSHVLIEKLGKNVKFTIYSCAYTDPNGHRTLMETNYPFDPNANHKDPITATVSITKMVSFFLRATAKSVAKYPGFTDFILPWLLFGSAVFSMAWSPILETSIAPECIP